jgi:hypothetical protein
MKRVVGKIALIALCSVALAAVGHNNAKAQFNITGSQYSSGVYTVPFPLYGPDSGQNNVVNNPGSGLVDATSPAIPSSTPWLQGGSVNTIAAGNYTVGWFFAGQEAGDKVTFTTGGTVPISFTANNQNNNCTNCPWASPSAQIGYQFLNTTTYALGANTAIPFSLSFIGYLSGVANNGGPITPGASLIFSYVAPVYIGDVFQNEWQLQTAPSDWFAFGLNDNGSGDDNHDDYMGFAFVSATGQIPPEATPIPAALPLFGSVLGGGFLFGRFRKRRQGGAPVAAV